MRYMLLRNNDITMYLYHKTIVDGFLDIENNLNPKSLKSYIKSYIEVINMYDFNNFLRSFAKTVIIDYLREHISIQMAYYLYNIDWGREDSLDLFCRVYKLLMTEFHRRKFLLILEHLGKRTAYIYNCRNDKALKLYIEVFEYRYVSEYIKRKIKSPKQLYKEIEGYYEFNALKLEIHRYLIKVYNFTRY